MKNETRCIAVIPTTNIFSVYVVQYKLHVSINCVESTLESKLSDSAFHLPSINVHCAFKGITNKSWGEVSLVEQDTIENVSWPTIKS